MKKLILTALLSVASLAALSAQARVTVKANQDIELYCASDLKKGPVILAQVFVKGQTAAILGSRIESANTGLPTFQRPLENCVTEESGDNVYAEVTDSSVQIECMGDGDAGVLRLQKRASGAYVGQLQFPEGKRQLGLKEDSKVPVICRTNPTFLQPTR